MTPPRVVVFDLGKVLVDFDYEIAARKIAAESRIDAPSLRKLIDHSPLLFEFETGMLTPETFYQRVSEATGYRGGFEEFARCFADIFSEIEPMIALQRTLRDNGIPTYIFSNTNAIAVKHIRALFPFFANFTGYVLSYEERVMKPDPRLYEVMERRTGYKGDAIVYLDDRAENVATGTLRGWRALLHETPETTIRALQNLGLPCRAGS